MMTFKHEKSPRIDFVVTDENLYTIAVDGCTGDPMAYRIEKNPQEVLTAMLKHGAKLYRSKSCAKCPAFFKELEQAVSFAEEFVIPVVLLQDMAGFKPKSY